MHCLIWSFAGLECDRYVNDKTEFLKSTIKCTSVTSGYPKQKQNSKLQGLHHLQYSFVTKRTGKGERVIVQDMLHFSLMDISEPKISALNSRPHPTTHP